ncbi:MULTISPECIES: acetyl-CoA carboxylase biotin carboxylase subunit [Bradyrhizobium]|jgi:acetyl-CoA carboxylase biotin carboxylase subunit|uniref:biotin carboxylase n=2 Tax=Bradyrhizobium TaxID=374 RepID=A0ABS5GAA3_9BRAD|nr:MULTISPECIES: acetyl-CoA carboxylase biotin carboxylase subunit [Bradyrhizobium]RTL94933.1 MAG: acetyl-CoA carboxylase biotin carboxylase subunit [Bradyrhizobiaceae bacterium]ABQ34604.1 acetyl CoA carboxylase, biotin carboxylase subunit [Bradyrhizobium sp. BTAi1]MBR1138056.1 acetyl-CoA carboxylase biotin carboxylase subunit [Bradyrhizobium denitrificans]MCL8483873.1 acetyl-CoA carboxylase biotin carboxylase subunit [Bradyrhizobium denitrificans]MDU1493577.1 acetyl-CoA carboxylase biotin car
MTLRSVLIANRGEIAVRIIRAAKALGLRTVLAHSIADKESLAAQLADETVEIGPPAAKKSYLNIEAVVNAAKSAKVDAVHPGYGFLAENAEFAEAVTAAGIVFVGPSAEAIRLLGDKVMARQVAALAGVPTVPGSDGRVTDLDAAITIANSIGYPVMIKAAAGGGGRGIRIVGDAEEFARQFPQASSEAAAAFGDGGLYIEKVIERARHVEVQILGDGHDVVHCYERECSLQRRRQKVWEEAPAVGLPDDVRQRLCASAVALGRAVGYSGAGTVEYLYDDATSAFYFIEVNTRIQVEHPVTEMITGIDLVQEMLTIAGGARLSVAQDDIRIQGHAIECRINAEDPHKGFMPAPGTIERLVVPDGEGIRFDTLLFEGYAVPPFYDSLLGKLIVRGADRADCLARLRTALDGLVITGIPTTIPLHAALARDASVADGRTHTRFLEPWLETDFAQLARAREDA